MNNTEDPGLIVPLVSGIVKPIGQIGYAQGQAINEYAIKPTSNVVNSTVVSPITNTASSIFTGIGSNLMPETKCKFNVNNLVKFITRVGEESTGETAARYYTSYTDLRKPDVIFIITKLLNNDDSTSFLSFTDKTKPCQLGELNRYMVTNIGSGGGFHPIDKPVLEKDLEIVDFNLITEKYKKDDILSYLKRQGINPNNTRVGIPNVSVTKGGKSKKRNKKSIKKGGKRRRKTRKH
jgi:hypothetical protein